MPRSRFVRLGLLLLILLLRPGQGTLYPVPVFWASCPSGTDTSMYPAPVLEVLPAMVFEPGLTDFERDLARQALTQAVRRVTRDFSWFEADSWPVVEFYSSSAAGRTSSPWLAGVYLPEAKRVLIQHLPVLHNQGRLASTIGHELIHAALWSAGRARLPLWLEEGSAIYFSEQDLGRPVPDANPAASLEELEARFILAGRHQDQAAWRELKTLNLQARALVARLVELGGRGHFIGFLRTMKNGTRLDQALFSWYELARAELEGWL